MDSDQEGAVKEVMLSGTQRNWKLWMVIVVIAKSKPVTDFDHRPGPGP
jgi:hypothetical protein